MTLLYIKRVCELNKSHIISTDEDPGLRIESLAVIIYVVFPQTKLLYVLLPCKPTKNLISIFSVYQ
jgi:hypothetical protein